MSYCVNCGVELAKSEKRCPLCDVEVINPAAPFDESAARPYPKHVERINERVDRRYAAIFISLLMLIPLFITIFMDLIVNGGGFSWSLYVIGGTALLFTCAILPMLLQNRRPALYVLLDGAALAILLLLIERVGGSRWFLPLGLPLAALATAFTLISLCVFSKKARLDPLVRWAVQLTLTGLLTVGVELIVDRFLGQLSFPRWSMYAMFPCLVLSVCLLTLNRKAKVKDEIRRRFFI